MSFRAHGRRCAVDISTWDLPFSPEEALSRLTGLGFRTVHVDLVDAMQNLVGRSVYSRGAPFARAPEAVDCSSFTKWLYALRGIWLPRRAIHQCKMGERVPDDMLRTGDLVFANYYKCAPIGPEEERVSHVGIIDDGGGVIHASPDAEGGVCRIELAWMRSWLSWCGGRRLIHPDHLVVTLECPPTFEIETSDDVYWALIERVEGK